MDCPVCQKPMIVVERDRIELDYCPFEHGVWFDAEEIDLLQEAAGIRPPDWEMEFVRQNTESGRPCPRCSQIMYKYSFISCSRKGQETDLPPLLLDICPDRHGIWFDKDELAQFFSPGQSQPALIQFLGNLVSKDVSP